MTKTSSVVVLIFSCVALFTKAQSFERKTLISGLGNYSRVKNTTTFENISFNTNTSKSLSFELSAVYFVTSRIAIGAAGTINSSSFSYARQQINGTIISNSIDSSITRETGGAARIDVLLIDKDKFAFGLKASGGSYIVVKRSVLISETLNPPTSFSNITEQTTKGTGVRLSVVPVLYYKISKHVLAQLSYASLFYSKTISEILPPAKQNSIVETAYGANFNYSSFALGLSLLL